MTSHSYFVHPHKAELDESHRFERHNWLSNWKLRVIKVHLRHCLTLCLTRPSFCRYFFVPQRSGGEGS